MNFCPPSARCSRVIFCCAVGSARSGPRPAGRGRSGSRGRQPISPADTLGFPVIGYFGFWGVMSIVAFSLAGEKMPWLTNHITLPLILLSGWSIGKFIDGSDWTLFRERRAWLVALLLPVTVVALSAALGSLLGNQLHRSRVPIWGNCSPPACSSPAPWWAVIGGVALYALGAPLGFSHVLRLAVLSVFALLALLTARAAFIAAYVNYDDANEFLVYAHGAQGVKTVMSQIEDISMRTQDGFGIKVAYDSDVAWPMTWYFRDYTNQSYYGDYAHARDTGRAGGDRRSEALEQGRIAAGRPLLQVRIHPHGLADAGVLQPDLGSASATP